MEIFLYERIDSVVDIKLIAFNYKLTIDCNSFNVGNFLMRITPREFAFANAKGSDEIAYLS